MVIKCYLLMNLGHFFLMDKKLSSQNIVVLGHIFGRQVFKMRNCLCKT